MSLWRMLGRALMPAARTRGASAVQQWAAQDAVDRVLALAEEQEARGARFVMISTTDAKLIARAARS